MRINVRTEKMQAVEVFGKPALYSESRLDRDSVPPGWHCYDLRLAEFCAEHELPCPATSKFSLRPAAQDEKELFYSNARADESHASIGHLRIDFGRDGMGLWTTWWEHNKDKLNTPGFKTELDDFVNALREDGLLKNYDAMANYCYDHQAGRIEGEWTDSYAYIAESESYRYCLRCIPRRGEYNAYLYIRQAAASIESARAGGWAGRARKPEGHDLRRNVMSIGYKHTIF